MPTTADCRDEPAARRALRFRRIDVVQGTLIRSGKQISTAESFDADGVQLQLQLQLPESRVNEAQARIVDISRERGAAT